MPRYSGATTDAEGGWWFAGQVTGCESSAGGKREQRRQRGDKLCCKGGLDVFFFCSALQARDRLHRRARESRRFGMREKNVFECFVILE